MGADPEEPGDRPKDEPWAPLSVATHSTWAPLAVAPLGSQPACLSCLLFRPNQQPGLSHCPDPFLGTYGTGAVPSAMKAPLPFQADRGPGASKPQLRGLCPHATSPGSLAGRRVASSPLLVSDSFLEFPRETAESIALLCWSLHRKHRFCRSCGKCFLWDVSEASYRLTCLPSLLSPHQ